VCCSVLQCVAVCCSVLQCVAVRCSVLQCVAVFRFPSHDNFESHLFGSGLYYKSSVFILSRYYCALHMCIVCSLCELSHIFHRTYIMCSLCASSHVYHQKCILCPLCVLRIIMCPHTHVYHMHICIMCSLCVYRVLFVYHVSSRTCVSRAHVYNVFSFFIITYVSSHVYYMSALCTMGWLRLVGSLKY